ncbi:MAG: tetratricopeptide repeat protein [Bacteroidales bacterium]|nr:tetratricopeptide repeat protein [Bacteroidales bacterium]
MKGREKAYYGLLYTIAMHKNRIPFTSDSMITETRKWYEERNDDPYNQARSLFYNGLVLYKLSPLDTMALHYMQLAKRMIDDNSIDDDRLAALIDAYLGKINKLNSNIDRAADYYRSAIEKEKRLGNTRNEVLDYCELLICLSSIGDIQQAKEVFIELDSVVSKNPKFQTNNIDNAKAIFFLHCTSQLDSALHYCQRWKPAPSDIGAKSKILASIYRRKGDWENAIDFEKAAYEQRRESDKTVYYIYYHNLADLYSQLGNADSTAHYALLAYNTLHDSYVQKTEKRVLELEKQYDLAARDAALGKARHQRDFLALIAIVFILLSAGVIGILYARHRKLVAERLTRSVIQAAAKTHQNTLSQLRELRKKPKSRTVQSLQEDIGEITRDIQRGFSQNFSEALENNLDLLPPSTRKAAARLSGARAKIVFILSEMGYTDAEIAEYTCTSADSVRVMINNNRKIILSDEPQTDQPD